MRFFIEDDYFTGPLLNDELVRNAEHALGVRLPRRYLELLRERNGGVPSCRCIPVEGPTSWAENHVEVLALRGIAGQWGIDAPGLGSKHMIDEWGYPSIGVVICEMPSGGHDAVMLDYSKCGPTGEPSVAYIDEDRSVCTIAGSFSEFLSKLEPCA